MKAIIFAGGAGTRLWPLSRRKSPKQFEKLIGDKSTLQLAVDRLIPQFKPEDIFISTNRLYKKTITEQLPQIPKKNFIFEPEKKDVGPAIALVIGMLYQQSPNEPITILWSDHLIKRNKLFLKILQAAERFLYQNPEMILFFGQRPRFPSTNLGYIHFGKQVAKIEHYDLYRFEGFKYKPDELMAKNFFNSGHYAWNPGYFVSTAKFIYESYERFAPNVFNSVKKILAHYKKSSFNQVLENEYRKIESISFDNAILENLDKKNALVINEDIGWSDIGAWEALKEALENHPYENVIRGKVLLEHVRDSMIYNYEDSKLIVGLDLDENIIVNTKDVILITKKTSINKLQKLVKSLEGTENEKLI